MAKAPKYPRVMVSPSRHKQLTGEAKKQNKSIAALSEEVFAKKFGKI